MVSTVPAGNPGTCTNCHAVHGNSGAAKQLKTAGANLCFANGSGCHSLAANSASGTVDQAKFTSVNGYTSRHSVDPAEQATYGTRVDCLNCHNPHLNNATSKTVNPDNRYAALNQWVDSGVANYLNSEGVVYILAKAKHDGTPPVISSLVHTVNNAVYSVIINWNTDEKATRQVEWGTTVDYVYSTGSSTLVYNSPHAITLTGLTTGVDYHYRVKSADALGNVSYSTDRVFRFSAPPGTPANLRHIPSTLPSGNSNEAVRLEWDAAVDPDGDSLQY